MGARRIRMRAAFLALVGAGLLWFGATAERPISSETVQREHDNGPLLLRQKASRRARMARGKTQARALVGRLLALPASAASLSTEAKQESEDLERQLLVLGELAAPALVDGLHKQATPAPTRDRLLSLLRRLSPSHLSFSYRPHEAVVPEVHQ
jgi:hypothetical protein